MVEPSETLPRSGTLRNGTLLRRKTWGRPIGGSGYSSWPTPAKSDTDAASSVRPLQKAQVGLPNAVKLWPTATARDHKSGKASEATHAKNARPLSEAVDKWATPGAGSLNSLRGKGQPPEVRKTAGHQVNLQDQVATAPGMLNPRWVETLMGFPIGWTQLDGPPLRESPSTSGNHPEPARAIEAAPAS